MVMKMNKTEFINELSKRLSYSEEQCIIINDILETNFFISKKNREKIIEDLIQRLNIENTQAEDIYSTAVSIFNEEIKNKIKHPFKSKD